MTKETKQRREHISNAADALSDLNTFAIVVSILEGGHIHAPSYAAGQRIIAIAKKEQGKRLRDYDRLVKRAGGGNYGDR